MGYTLQHQKLNRGKKVTRGDLNLGFIGPLFILGLFAFSFGVQADPVGDCTSGTQYCEDNGLTTINTTVTTNTNTNNNKKAGGERECTGP